jgi:hypothetical protein
MQPQDYTDLTIRTLYGITKDNNPELYDKLNVAYYADLSIAQVSKILDLPSGSRLAYPDCRLSRFPIKSIVELGLDIDTKKELYLDKDNSTYRLVGIDAYGHVTLQDTATLKYKTNVSLSSVQTKPYEIKELRVFLLDRFRVDDTDEETQVFLFTSDVTVDVNEAIDNINDILKEYRSPEIKDYIFTELDNKILWTVVCNNYSY